MSPIFSDVTSDKCEKLDVSTARKGCREHVALEVPLSVRRPGLPSNALVSPAHASLPPERQFNRFLRFCTAHCHDQRTQTTPVRMWQ